MWIDIVFSGGGVKGFAFPGALHVLEQAGFRFKRAAGTSAGAITAALLAAGYTSVEMRHLMEQMDAGMLLDRQKRPSFSLFRWLNIYQHMGVDSGDSLEQWIEDALDQKNVHTFADIDRDRLKIIVTDVTRGRLVVLPDELSTYGIDAGTFSVAHAARMSAGLPFFFRPVPLNDAEGTCSLIVDGGLLSNFPLWIFDRDDGRPVRPFLGLQTTSGIANAPRVINNATDLFKGIFSTMQDAFDEKTVEKLRDSNVIVIPINHVDTKNFSISMAEKQRLYRLGEDETKIFLKKWSY
ncbi:MAG: patatin-like phospholipase family protein [Sporolactobacillus sp.]